jgi:uncharacterized protein
VTVSVLDSWAMLGWLQGEEPVRAKVREMLERVFRGEAAVEMPLINVGEVFYLIARRHGSATAERSLSEILGMPLQTLLPHRRLILNAAPFEAVSRCRTRTRLQSKQPARRRRPW